VSELVPSDTENVNESVPVCPAADVYEHAPALSQVTVPFVGGVTGPVNVNVSSLGSDPVNVMGVATRRGTSTVWASAVGAVFDRSTVIAAEPVPPWPSSAVKVNASVPVAPASERYVHEPDRSQSTVPFVGAVVTEYVSGSPLASEPVTVIGVDTWTAADTVSALATGFELVRLIVTVPEALDAPSVTEKVNESVPNWPALEV
jgi:hypothetical protein